MNSIGFDNEKYLKLQSQNIRDRIGKFGGKPYLEFGGKLFDDFYASRVLPGFKPDSKVRMLMEMKDEAYYQTIGAPAFWTSAATMFNAPIADLDANLEEALAEKWCYKADTLEELAEITGCENLAATVREYDGYVAAGEDPVFHKQPALMQPIGEEGPFYLFEYNPSAFNTFGGCRTDHLTRALKPNFEVIPGLYIAGVENGSLYSSPYYDVGGTCNGLSLASGRLAGMEMAKYVAE